MKIVETMKNLLMPNISKRVLINKPTIVYKKGEIVQNIHGETLKIIKKCPLPYSYIVKKIKP